MPSWKEAAVVAELAAESTACTWVEVVEVGTVMVTVIPEAVVPVMAEASTPAFISGTGNPKGNLSVHSYPGIGKVHGGSQHGA